jgi:hypothetical protein
MHSLCQTRKRFEINELMASARDLRTFLVRAAAILPHSGPSLWLRLTYSHSNEAQKSILMDEY